MWDGLPAHRSKLVLAWLGRQRSWLVMELLLGYAHERNPIEALWASLKGTGLATWPATPWRRSSRRPSVASSGSGAPRTCRFVPAPLRTVPMVQTTSLEPATFFGLAHAGSL